MRQQQTEIVRETTFRPSPARRPNSWSLRSIVRNLFRDEYSGPDIEAGDEDEIMTAPNFGFEPQFEIESEPTSPEVGTIKEEGNITLVLKFQE